FGVQSAVFDGDDVGSTVSISTVLNGEGGAFAGGVLSDRPDADAATGGASAPGPRGGVQGSHSRGDAISRRHGLRIDPGSLRSFGKYVAVLPGRKLAQLASVIAQANAKPQADFGEVRRTAEVIW